MLAVITRTIAHVVRRVCARGLWHTSRIICARTVSRIHFHCVAVCTSTENTYTQRRETVVNKRYVKGVSPSSSGRPYIHFAAISLSRALWFNAKRGALYAIIIRGQWSATARGVRSEGWSAREAQRIYYIHIYLSWCAQCTRTYPLMYMADSLLICVCHIFIWRCDQKANHHHLCARFFANQAELVAHNKAHVPATNGTQLYN